MTVPRWIHDLHSVSPQEGGPLVLCQSLDSPESYGLMAHAPLYAEDFAAFAHAADAAYRLARRKLVKALVGRVAGVHPGDVRIGRSSLGAPVIETPEGWHLSVSGRSTLCLIGIAREPIGVDIEPPTETPPPMDHFTGGERTWLQALSRRRGWHNSLALWVAKEAHAKMTGKARVIDAIDIDVRSTPGGFVARSSDAVSQIWLRRSGRSVAAVALNLDLLKTEDPASSKLQSTPDGIEVACKNSSKMTNIEL